MSKAHEIAVVGLGAIGAAALYQLARRGIDAIGIDRHAPPHVHGSSHGETRITRQAIGEGAEYVPLAIRAHAIWRELERATGASLFERCGGLVIGRIDDGARPRGELGFLPSTIAQARRFGIAHELLDRGALAERFPQFIGVEADEIGYFEPGAGFLRPEACIEAQLGEARRLGATILTGVAVGGLRERGGGVEIETDAGPIRAARAIVAAGAWTGDLLGAPFDRLLTVTRQALFWFEADDPGLFDVAGGCPVFIREHGPREEDAFYGFPTPAGSTGVKVATESYDDALTADAYVAGEARADAAGFHARHVAGRLAGVTPRLVRSLSCLYTNTATARFLIDTHPEMPRVLAVSACSGHGFKHSAAIGELAADRARSDMLLAPFALAGHAYSAASATTG